MLSCKKLLVMTTDESPNLAGKSLRPSKMMQGNMHKICPGQEMLFPFPLYYSAESILQKCFKCEPCVKPSWETCDFRTSKR
jgi:hypothetical protein